MKFDVVLAIVPYEKESKAVCTAKEAGATGATVFSAHGTGIKEAKTFFGLTVELKQVILLTLVERHIAQRVMKSLYDELDMKSPGNGIIFSFPIDAVMGLESQLSVIKRKAEEEYSEEEGGVECQ
jgi:nitrogen regulatory protein P-II 1